MDLNTLTVYWPYFTSTFAGAAVTAIAFLWFDSPEPSGHLLAMLKYLVHIAVGTMTFGAIGAATLAIHLFIDKIRPLDTPELIISGLILAEYAVFIADLMLFFIFVFRSSIMFANDISEA